MGYATDHLDPIDSGTGVTSWVDVGWTSGFAEGI